MKQTHLPLLSLILLGLIFPSLVLGAGHELMGMRVSKVGALSELIFSLSNIPQVRTYVLTDPDRIAIDFPDTRLKVNLQNTSLQGTLFKKVRNGYPDGRTLRVVLDLSKKVTFKLVRTQKTITLKAYLSAVSRKSIASKLKSASIKQKPVLQHSLVKPMRAQAQHAITVVIDPGHGGQDPGAVGEKGTQEKTVVLAIAKQLALLINQTPHMRAVLTRDTDVFIPLVERLKLARKGKADLFIAIHADSYFDKHSQGASVYALSRGGATSVAARWLSNRENHSELCGLNLKELDDQSLQLRSVLIDLAQTATIIDSLRLGKSLLGSLDDVTPLHYKRVEQAPFLVLKSPDIPSILIETGFLSNKKEEENLRDPRYQRKMADAIFNGIHIYLKKYSSTLL